MLKCLAMHIELVMNLVGFIASPAPSASSDFKLYWHISATVLNTLVLEHSLDTLQVPRACVPRVLVKEVSASFDLDSVQLGYEFHASLHDAT